MERPRIIIAETDVEYVLPLQQIFVAELFDRADLEIITEREYFEILFSAPQKAEILIVSEDLYDMKLQKHNIAHVFLLSEQEEKGDTAELNVNLIYKYTSIRDIFHVITGKSADVLQTEAGGKKEAQIVVVTSASGGVGKTTTAVGLAAVLSKNYRRVLYINTDSLQTFRHLLQNHTPITGNDIYSELMHADNGIYGRIRHVIRKELFNYLPPFKAALISLGLGPDVFGKIAASARSSGDFDVVLVDADSSFDENKTKLLELADKVIFVTGQNAASVTATNILIENINGIDNEKYVFLCNNFERDADNALISPQIPLKFGVSEYVEHFHHYDRMKGVDFAGQTCFQRAAYLLE
ncbi:MAG: AAA family ATPase [Clostridiales bacterium]|nr:AAA family ATPase [Clostridiales bacterium]